jgi:Reverse transcriptase (RNA-dependent DNA polymerase)
MDEELENQHNHNTFSYCSILLDRKAIPVYWVFKTKYNTDGSIKRYKARLVAKGFMQRYGEDYFNTFALVARMTSVRIVLAIAAYQRLDVEQVDVDGAFLNSLIDAEIYMEQPLGYVNSQFPNYVCKLTKKIYGLKQAGCI